MIIVHDILDTPEPNGHRQIDVSNLNKLGFNMMHHRGHFWSCGDTHAFVSAAG